MKRLFALVLLFAGFAASAQNDGFGVVKVSSDSLVRFVQKEFGTRIYFLKDEADVQNYTLKSERDKFAVEAVDLLRKSGYIVTEYDGAMFITAGKGFSTALPSGYFDKVVTGANDDALLKYMDNRNAVVTFQNKIYEIGDPTVVKTGKVAVSGYVHDITSGEPIVGVSVYSQSGGAYAQTDAYGYYTMLLPVGPNDLGFSGYSLEDIILDLVVYDKGGLNVEMKEKVFSLTGAVVTSESNTRHRTPQMGIEKVRMDVIKNVPAVFGEADVIKVVTTLPGVKTVGEASSGYNVRGGSTDQNLILFNGGTVYNPSHMFGVLSAFNPDVVSDIELYKSSIPAEYGGRISSVLKVGSRDGNPKKVIGSLGVGLLTSRFHLEGPVGSDRTTFNLGARTTYSNWILNLLPENCDYTGGSASFQDVNLGISHRINENNTVHVYGYYSRDKFKFSNDTSYRYRNSNASLKWRSVLSDRHSMEFFAGYDNYLYGIEDGSNAASAYSLTSSLSQIFAKASFKYVLTDKHVLNYGISSLLYDIKPGSMHPSGERSIVIPIDMAAQNALENAVYVSDTWSAGSRLSADMGLRYSFFVPVGGGEKVYGGPEFRLSGKYSFTDNFSFKAGFNTMRQYIHMVSDNVNISPTDVWTLSNGTIKPQDGWQAAAGLYASLVDNTVDLSVEAYYKAVNHFVDYRSGAKLIMNENLADDLIETEGKSYGVEFLARKNLGKLNGWISYTYSRSQLRESQYHGPTTINGGKWYNASYDKPHDFKLVGNYKFTHRFSFSLNVDYSTGRPVTIPVGKYEYAGGVRLVYSDRNTYRIPDYFRMDAALIVEPGHYLKKLTHMSFTIGCYNVTGRKNPYSIYYTTEGGSNISGHMMSVFATQIPYVNFDLKF